MPKRQGAAVYPPLGHFMKRVMKARGINGKELAKKAGLRPAQVSAIRHGANTAWAYYDLAARAMGFRGALEMFMSGGDRETARLLRVWSGISDDEVRRDVLVLVRRSIEGEEEPTATSPEESDDGPPSRGK